MWGQTDLNSRLHTYQNTAKTNLLHEENNVLHKDLMMPKALCKNRASVSQSFSYGFP